MLLRWSMCARRAWSETLARVAVILSLRGVGNVSEPVARRMPDELSPRHLALRVAQIAAVIAIGAVAISALPGLDEVRQRLAGTEPVWVAALVLAELGSCAGYVLVFRDTFCSQMPWGLSYEIAMAELAADSLLPAGGAGGLALGVWALRQAGMPTAQIARRTVAFFIVTSAANFFALIVVGLAVFAGLIAGRRSEALTLVPALVTAFGVLAVTISPELLRALGARGADADPDRWRGRVRLALRASLAAGADGVEQAIALLRTHSAGSSSAHLPTWRSTSRRWDSASPRSGRNQRSERWCSAISSASSATSSRCPAGSAVRRER